MVNNQDIVLLESFPSKLETGEKVESFTRARSEDSGVLSIESSIQEEDESKDELEEFSKDAKLCLSLIKKLKNCFLDEKFSKDEKLAGQFSKIKNSIQFTTAKKSKKSKRSENENAKENMNSKSKRSSQKQKSSSAKSTSDVLSESSKDNQMDSNRASKDNQKSSNKTDAKKNQLQNDKSADKSMPRRRANTFSNDGRLNKLNKPKRNSLSDSTEKKSSTSFLTSRFSSNSLLRLPIGPNNRDNGFRDRLKRSSLQFD